MKTPALALFDLNAIVPNLVGAYREGIAAAFRMFDEELDEELLTVAVGLSYSDPSGFAQEWGQSRTVRRLLTFLCWSEPNGIERVI